MCIISLELAEGLVHSLVVQDVLTFPAGREELPEHVLERCFVRRSKLECFILLFYRNLYSPPAFAKDRLLETVLEWIALSQQQS